MLQYIKIVSDIYQYIVDRNRNCQTFTFRISETGEERRNEQ